MFISVAGSGVKGAEMEGNTDMSYRGGRLNSIGDIVQPIHICGVELSNKFLLRVAAFSFLTFVLAEVVGAFASNSLSLLGDAAAMSVDVFTYFCNMYSEHVKEKYGKVDHTTRLILEVGVPSFSATALIAVSTWITYDAILIIIDPPHDSDVDVAFLFGFAAGNFLVDIICAALFYLRRHDVLKSEVQKPLLEEQYDQTLSESQEVSEEGNTHTHSLNLNMASALTHVGGDTLRTAAVFIAAMVASLSDIDSTLCDAWAAVVVTVTIIFLVVPLVKEITKAYRFLSEEAKTSSALESEAVRNSTI